MLLKTVVIHKTLNILFQSESVTSKANYDRGGI